MEEEIRKAILLYGVDRIAVGAGVTGSGIGRVYEIASRLNIRHTFGSIAGHASNQDDCKPHAACCQDHIIYLSVPQNSWELLDPRTRKSFTLAPLWVDGILPESHAVVIGGHKTGVTEVEQILTYALPYTSYTAPNVFGPNEDVAKCKGLHTDEEKWPVHFLIQKWEEQRASRDLFTQSHHLLAHA